MPSKSPRRSVVVLATFVLLLLVMSAGAAEAQLRSVPYLSGLSLPVAIVQDPTDSGVELVVEQAGRIRVVRDGILREQDFLDLRSEVAFGGERGLFSIAFPSDTATSGRFFVNFTRRSDGSTSRSLGATVVARFNVVPPPGTLARVP